MSAPKISSLSHGEQNILDELWLKWSEKLFRNELRSTYYDTKNYLKSLKISLPPQLESAEAMLAWPAKAVHVLGDRIALDGFVVPGEDVADPFGLKSLLDANEFDVELPQAITSSLVHSLSLVTVTKGDTASGEPDVQVLARSARHSAALWDRRRRGVSAALAITAARDDDSTDVTGFVLYLPDAVLVCSKVGVVWRVDRRPNPVGRVLVAPLRFRPELDRPFGHSRITRAVMQLTDAAVRTFVRGEVGAEFFSTPQRFALGAEEGQFDGDNVRWRAVMSRMLAISRDEDGNVPQLGQFQQMSMQPHMDQLRSIAALFAGETSVPLNSLGIVQDNPSSAEAIYAAKEELVIAAHAANRVYGASLKQMAISALMVRDGLTEVPDDFLNIEARFRNPATPSVVSAADAAVKLASAAPWFAESEVFWEQVGYDRLTIARLMADKRRVEARQTVAQLGLAAQKLGEQRTAPAAAEDAQAVPIGES